MMPDYLDLMCQHLDKIITSGTADFGPDPNAMWMASLDIRTGKYPADDTRPPHIGQRVYRLIDAPRGSTLYWDQPQVVAAHHLSRVTGNPAYQQAGEAYVQDFLLRCVANNGLFVWGNHYYYDVVQGTAVRFLDGRHPPEPVDFSTETSYLHEIRPVPPAWALFWEQNPALTELAIRRVGEKHVFDAETGGFNRHADNRQSYDFIEAGGILAETLAWLYAKTKDSSLCDLALKIARYSFAGCHPETGLIENSRDSKRWDKVTSTTEVGLWASSLLRAQAYTGVAEFGEMAAPAVLAYLKYGYDEGANRYYGRLNVADGTPQTGDKETTYQPGVYADIWNALFPTHDYPTALADSCVSLYEQTGNPAFEQAVHRWARIIDEESQNPDGSIRYAEHYGRAIRFLLRASRTFDHQPYHQQADALAQQAMEQLFDCGMFRSHTGEDRYDAVDGVGYLMLALIDLVTDEEPDLMGFGF